MIVNKKAELSKIKKHSYFLHDLSYLFQNVNFTIKKDDKIGLVGKNGAGLSKHLHDIEIENFYQMF